MSVRTSTFLLAFMVSVPSSALADAAAGRVKSAVCMTCHGTDGMGRIPNAPHIAGQPETYLSEQLKAYRDGKRQDPMMTVVAKQLTDQDIANLAAWYSSIQVTATLPP